MSQFSGSPVPSPDDSKAATGEPSRIPGTDASQLPHDPLDLAALRMAAFPVQQGAEQLNGSAGPVHRNGTLLTPESVPVYFVFRRNGIYENYLRQIKQALEDSGRTVQVIGLSPDLRSQDIPAELKKHSIPYDRIILYVDRTVGSHLPSRVDCPGLATSSIDSIFSACGLSIICKELGIQVAFEVQVEERPGQNFLQAYLDAHRERFQSVFSRALKTKEPDMIVIDSRCMNEHIPFYILSSKHPERQAARFLRRWIHELDYPAEKIFVTHDIAKLDPEGFLDCSRIWFIGDRHWQDKPQGRGEIERFVQRVANLQRRRQIDEALRLGKEERELDEFDIAAGYEDRMPWDGDDGIDRIDQIDLSEAELEEPPLSEEEADELEEQIAELNRSAFSLHYLDVPTPKIAVRYLALPMDSLLESMVAQNLLPVDHVEQGARFVSLAAETIESSLAGIAQQVVKAYSNHS